MKRIMPGVYDDNRGGLHLVVPELLRANGYPDTPENRAMIEREARKAFAPTTPITVTDEPAP